MMVSSSASDAARDVVDPGVNIVACQASSKAEAMPRDLAGAADGASRVSGLLSERSASRQEVATRWTKATDSRSNRPHHQL
jgi:hypothetical protein